jgi:hypothetical protein
VQALDEKDVRSSSRHSLQVRRYHCWPMLQDQRTDAHTLQMLRIYCCVWGPPSPIVSWNIIFHDAGEASAGDVQFQAKRDSPELKSAVDEAEEAHLELIWETDLDPAVQARRRDWHAAFLTHVEKWCIKAVDLVEGLEHALTDVAMGNRLAGPVVEAYTKGFHSHCAKEEGTAGILKPLSDYLGRPYHSKLWCIYREVCGRIEGVHKVWR